MSTTRATDDRLSFWTQTAILRYAPALRAALVQAAIEKKRVLGRDLLPGEIGECVGEILAARNVRFEDKCWRDYKAGRSQSLQDVLNELRRSVAT